MRLLAPAGNLNSVKKVLEAGADDVYIGGISKGLNNYSFNGRAVYSITGKRIQAYADELKEIVKVAHAKGVGVTYLANTPFLNNSRDMENNRLLDMFKDYINVGVEAGVDAIVVGDMGALKIIKEMDTGIELVASSYFEAQNIPAIDLLVDMGIEQVILSYQSTLDEITHITKNTSAKIEVFGHGGCSFYVGSCNLFHDAGENVEGGINVGYPCRGIYRVFKDGEFIQRSRFLDGFKICSLCQIPELIEAGVYMLKVVGRDLDLDYMVQVIRTYRKAIDLALNGESIVANRTDLIPIWWDKMWCQGRKRCRY